MNKILSHFSDPMAVARYTEGPLRAVPGFAAFHCMTGTLLAEHAPEDARVLVLGAGGGLELKALAESYPRWAFDGIDPAAEMLKLAQKTLGPLAERVNLHEGYIDDAPAGPYDAACCLLTFHFIERDERLRTAREIRRRLKPGAPFVVMHHSIPGDSERAIWLSRYTAFMLASDVPLVKAAPAGAALADQLDILTPEQDEALLRIAGFTNVSLFYAAFTFRGWIAYA